MRDTKKIEYIDGGNATLVRCESADGWSLHAPGSTDEAIASGDAPPLVDGPWEDEEHVIPAWAYSRARARLLELHLPDDQPEPPNPRSRPGRG